MTSTQSSHLIEEDLDFIKQLVDYSEEIIRNEMNFVKYYNQELKFLDRVELKCFKNENSLYKLILSVYASFEFTVKRMFEYILEIIEREKINIQELRLSIRALFFKENLDSIKVKINDKHNDDNKGEIFNKLLKIYNILEQEQTFIIKPNMINTRSNLNNDVLEEIFNYFDIDKKLMKPYRSSITSLLHYRNNIAHGNYQFADKPSPGINAIDMNNYERICENIIELTNKLFLELNKYIVDKKYIQNS